MGYHEAEFPERRFGESCIKALDEWFSNFVPIQVPQGWPKGKGGNVPAGL